MLIDVLLSPPEFEVLRDQNLKGTGCVVFDVLRATSTALTALVNGAAAVVPVRTLEEALAERRRDPLCLLAGERNGLRLTARETGSLDFDLGNSPREFTSDRVAGRTIVSTTTNGTRALKACAGAEWVAAGAFLNLNAIVEAVGRRSWPRVLLVCSGTGEGTAYEDVLAAGALADRLADRGAALTDAAHVARSAWIEAGRCPDPIRRRASNAVRLLANPDLAPDVDLCLRIDVFSAVPVLQEGRSLCLVPGGGG